MRNTVIWFVFHPSPDCSPGHSVRVLGAHRRENDLKEQSSKTAWPDLRTKSKSKSEKERYDDR